VSWYALLHKGVGKMHATRTMWVGKFKVHLNESVVVRVPFGVRQQLVDLLNGFPTRSMIVRLDMAPWDGRGIPPIYEVETAPGGLMFNFPGFLWNRLVPLATTAMCLDANWLPAYKLLVEKTGWELAQRWEGEGPFYFSGEKEAVPEAVKYRVITDPWCSKAEIIPFTGGEVVTADSDVGLGILRSKYPKGFVLKPIGGWGSRDVYMYPTERPFSLWAKKGEVKKALARAKNEPHVWMIQPFFPPEQVGFREFRIWRVFAVRGSGARTKPFRFLGGTWNCRPHPKVHGASNTIVGEVRI
jgi:hypothetical protein